MDEFFDDIASYKKRRQRGNRNIAKRHRRRKIVLSNARAVSHKRTTSVEDEKNKSCMVKSSFT